MHRPIARYFVSLIFSLNKLDVTLYDSVCENLEKMLFKKNKIVKKFIKNK